VLSMLLSKLSQPLLDVTMDGAKGLLFNVEGGPDLKLGQVNEAGRRLSSCADKSARIFFGFMNLVLNWKDMQNHPHRYSIKAQACTIIVYSDRRKTTRWVKI